MSNVKPKYDKAEFSRRGQEIFENEIAGKVAAENPDKFVAIDIETGDFELDDELLDAVHRLRERNPEAQVWIRCVGSRSIMRLGGVKTGINEAYAGEDYGTHTTAL